MGKWTIIAAAALSALVSSPVLAANCATVTFTTPTFPAFDPINGNYTAPAITATVTRINTNAKSVKLILLDTQTGPLLIGSAGPIYSVTSGGNNITYQTGTDVTAVTGAPVNTPTGSAVTASLTLTIPNTAQDFVGGTTFVENLRYSVQCFNNPNLGNGSVGTPDTGLSAFSISVPILSQVSITTAGPQTINFGSFTTTSQTLQVGVKSTSSINVAISTTNVGQMVLAGAVSPFPTNSTIPYTMTYAGTSIASGGSLLNQTRAGVVGANRALALTLTGGLPSGKLAGSYSDTITLTLTPGT